MRVSLRAGLRRRVLQVGADIEALSRRRERIENDPKLSIGTASGMEGVATWKTIDGHRFDGIAPREGEVDNSC